MRQSRASQPAACEIEREGKSCAERLLGEQRHAAWPTKPSARSATSRRCANGGSKAAAAVPHCRVLAFTRCPRTRLTASTLPRRRLPPSRLPRRARP
eukprot:350771-Chlamydomonas_euryale.AAC.2